MKELRYSIILNPEYFNFISVFSHSQRMHFCLNSDRYLDGIISSPTIFFTKIFRKYPIKRIYILHPNHFYGKIPPTLILTNINVIGFPAKVCRHEIEIPNCLSIPIFSCHKIIMNKSNILTF